MGHRVTLECSTIRLRAGLCPPSRSMTLLFAVLTLFVGAALVALASRLGRAHSAWAAGAVTLAALLWLAPSMHLPFDGTTLIQQFDWMPALGLNLAFRLDGLEIGRASCRERV